MELKDFIEKTLIEICEAVTAAGKSNQQIAPQIHSRFEPKMTPGSPVEFDIAVTTTENSSKEGGAGIQVLAAKIGGTKFDESEVKSATRIKFSVPIYFTVQNKAHNS